MREIDVKSITEAVAALCVAANRKLPAEVSETIRDCRDAEPWAPAKTILDELLRNHEAARQDGLPLCQDTGLMCVFLRLGQDAHITGGGLAEAVNEGVRMGFRDGLLRASVVRDPLRRTNTGDNTPAAFHVEIVPGERCEITVLPKGFGSENMSRLKMLAPADGAEGFRKFVLETVLEAGPNPCPPVVVGAGIGGTFDTVAALAKKALLRTPGEHHPDPFYQDLEQSLLQEINRTGIGPMGFGGRTTALAVHIEAAPTHIAGLPVAVNLNCHVARRASCVL